MEVVMVRIATVNDAEQLNILNNEFNGESETSIDNEITEVYVKPTYRKKGIASEMITFAEDYCSKNYPLHRYELLTGQENLVAQSVYSKLGYADDKELHLSKRVKK